MSDHPNKKAKLWGGRFTGETDPVMEKFNNSINYDKIMWKHDLSGSEKYAAALQMTGIITGEEKERIVDGLCKVAKEWETGTFAVQSSDEDIHTANERRLTELIGQLVGSCIQAEVEMTRWRLT